MEKWITEIICLIIIVFAIIIGISRKKKSSLKKPIKKSQNDGNKKSDSPSPTPKKSTDWGKTTRSVLWTLLLLSLLIVIIIGIVWGIQKIREPKPKPKAQTEVKEPVHRHDYFVKKDETIVIEWKKDYYYAYKYYKKVFYVQSFFRDGRVSKKILQGYNIPTNYHPNIKKEILSYYKEEGMVSVFYSKDIEELKKIPD